MSFDISSLALNDSFDLHLLHPVTGEKLYADKDEQEPVIITLFGSSSKQYRSAITGMQNRQLLRTKKKQTATADELKEEGIKLLVACSAGSQNLSFNGKVADNEVVFRAMYSDAKFSWLKDQVDEALGDISNFLEA